MIDAKQNTNLIGHDLLFNDLVKLDSNNKLPSKILISGKKGIGKSTLAFHFVNYLFSKYESNHYDLKNKKINPENKSYKLVKSDTHPNLFTIKQKKEKRTIEISQIREMISFINKSSFNNLPKIVIIDGSEDLNINSVNALLKVMEEPSNNISFLLIHNSDSRIAETLKSRCINFKLKLDNSFTEVIVNNYFKANLLNELSSQLKHYSFTPGYYIDFFEFCNENKINYELINLFSFINIIIDNKIYKNCKFIDNNFQTIVQLFFYNCLKSKKELNYYYLYKYFIKKIDLTKKFNLDFEPLFIELREKALND